MRPRPIALSLAAVAASAVGYALLRLGRRGPRERHQVRESQQCTCECGQAFRMTGTGRHRVYWLADASAGEPLLSNHCPSCDRPLPRAQDVRLVASAHSP
jgi:hypothetical protein